MATLKTNYAGIELTSPIIVGSASVTGTLEQLKRCAAAGAGAAVVKSYCDAETTRASPTPRFRILERSQTLYSYEQAPPYDLEQFAEFIARAGREVEMPVIASLLCHDDQNWLPSARAMEEVHPVGLELNTSCPHGSIAFSGEAVEARIIEAVSTVRQVVSMPLIVKLTPQLTNPIHVARRCVEVGADAVVMFNRLTGLDLDLEEEKPIMHGSYAGHGGPWALNLAMRWISAAANELDSEISASGGVFTAEDAIKLLLVGAKTVQVVSAILRHGHGVIGKLNRGLIAYMERHGYETIEDFRGIASQRILGINEVDRRQRVIAQITRRGAPPCDAACPLGVNACGYVTLIGEGKYEEAAALARERNPLSAVCGYVCDRPCEEACVRAQLDEPLAIASLKRFAHEMGGNALDSTEFNIFTSTASAFGTPRAPKPQMPSRKPHRIAVVGAGPAGLTAAQDLARLGYQVTAFESSPAPGGMLSNGIPSFRLPREVVAAEVEAIHNRGVEIRTGVTVGRSPSFDDLSTEGFTTFLLAFGAQGMKGLGVDGENLEGVFSGLKFLNQINAGGRPVLGAKVVVIGGGDMAMDSARAAIRLGADVTLLYRRSEAEMPARKDEIAEAIAEGVHLMPLVGVKKILGANGRVELLECERMTLGEKDTDGRPLPVPIPGSDFSLPATSVIMAVGQQPETHLLAQRLHLRLKEDRSIWSDPDTYATSRPNFFACGDLVGEGGSIIAAMASGRKAARGIHLSLSGEALDLDPFVVPRDSTPAEKVPVEDVPLGRRQPVPLLGTEKRSRCFEVAELPFREKIAVAEAKRCLSCGGCTLCGDCIRACPYLAIIKKDGTIMVTPDCEGCGLCAEICPTRVISMVPLPEDFWQRRSQWRAARGECPPSSVLE